MSTSVRSGGPAKKISSWVRPGVCEVRASALRPVSALIRLDLPTLERPANAISIPRIGGKTASEPAAAVKRQSPANSLRPRSISSEVNWVIQNSLHGVALCRWRNLNVWIAPLPTLPHLLCRLLLPCEHALDIVEQLDLGAVPTHYHRLLDHRERVVPGPVDHEPGREA